MLSINPKWETLDFGTEEEKACFARLGIQVHSEWLTKVHNQLTERVEKEALLSAYHLAEWLAWNWWRLRYEPKPKNIKDAQWLMAHSMAEIGSGYVWPPFTIISDGQRIGLINQAANNEQIAFHYLNNKSYIVQASEWEASIDGFISLVIERLASKNIESSNLLDIWQSVQEERSCSELIIYRKLEALLGYDPDEGPEDLIDELISAQDLLGVETVYELAANRFDAVPNLDALKGQGFTSNLQDRLVIEELPSISSALPAWELGSQLAQTVRQKLGNLGNPISSKYLAELMAVNEQVLDESTNNPLQVGYTLKTSTIQGKINLTGKRETGRRFDLARLLADQLLFVDDKLALAAPSTSYRQKMQRAFAAELLCPINLLQDGFDTQLSKEKQEEQQEDLAEHFGVSPLTVKNILMDNDLLERSDYSLREIA